MLEQQLTFFLALAAGLIFGGFAVWLMLRTDTANTYRRAQAEVAADHQALTERLTAREARIEDLSTERHELRTQVQNLREENVELRAANSELSTRLSESTRAANEKLEEMRQAREQLTTVFQAASAEALERNNKVFLDLARESLAKAEAGAEHDLDGRKTAIDEVVKPLKDSLERVDNNIRELEKSRATAYAGMAEQVRALVATQDLLRAETSNLVHALRTPSVRGRWGEVQLRRVAELAGMVPYCDFQEQATLHTDEGRLRPDMVVRLPNGRAVLVDAKVSLKAFLEALDASGEEERTAKLQEHAAQVRSHLDRLSSKAYWRELDATPEFVIAFLPGEAFFSAALQQDPGLIEYGVDRNVILATPTTLIALLKTVAFGWTQERVARNAEEIAGLGRSLYSRLRTFSRHVDEIRKHLGRTVDSYNRAAGSLESRVLVSARRFEDLGAASQGHIHTVAPVDTQPRVIQVEGEPVQAEMFVAPAPEEAESRDLYRQEPPPEPEPESEPDQEPDSQPVSLSELTELADAVSESVAGEEPELAGPVDLTPDDAVAGEPVERDERVPEPVAFSANGDLGTHTASAPKPEGGPSPKNAGSEDVYPVPYSAFVKTS